MEFFIPGVLNCVSKRGYRIFWYALFCSNQLRKLHLKDPKALKKAMVVKGQIPN